LALAGRAQAQPPGVEPGEKYHLLFATSGPFGISGSGIVPPASGQFGSLAAADWNVTFAAFVAGRVPGWNGLDLIYQAILSINGNNARDRIAIEGKIFNTHFDLLATDENDLWDNSFPLLLAPVGYDEFGNLITTSTDVWTGTEDDGTWSNNSCGDWNDPLGLGNVGFASSANGWIVASTLTCNQSARLYGISPAITLPDSAETGIHFGQVTTTYCGLDERGFCRALVRWRRLVRPSDRTAFRELSICVG